MAREKNNPKENRQSVLQGYTDGIDEKNANICTYRQLVPMAKPLIEKYAEYFKDVTVNWDSISLTPARSEEIPPQFFCEAIEMGILASCFNITRSD